jgi:hypothetical protein
MTPDERKQRVEAIRERADSIWHGCDRGDHELVEADRDFLLAEVDRLNAELEQARADSSLRSSQLLMVSSEACGDPKIDPSDLRDPRVTATLQDVARLRAELAAAREPSEAVKAWRAVLPEERAGLIALRGRGVDVLLYTTLSLLILFVALTITGGPLR